MRGSWSPDDMTYGAQVFLMQLPCIVGLVAGLAARYWWSRQTVAMKRRYADAAWTNRLCAGLAAVAALCLFGAFLWRHTELDPCTGRRGLFLFSDKVLGELSDEEEYRDPAQPPLMDAADPVHERVAGVTSRLLAANAGMDAIGGRRWTVQVLDSPAVNATVDPGGQVLVHVGLTNAANDDQLSIVLGHELAHCVLRHVNQLCSAVFVVNSLGLMPLFAAVWAALPIGWSVFAHLSSVALLKVCVLWPRYRKYENEADRVGLELAAKACVDVTQGHLFWDAMSKTDDCSTKLFWWMSMHPTNKSRARHLHSLIPVATEIRRLAAC